MKNYEIHCPFCDIEFMGEEWENGECPNCHEEYSFDEICTEDYSDCWTTLEWDWKKLINKKSCD